MEWKLNCVGQDCSNDLEDSEERWLRDGNTCRKCCEKANRGIKERQAKEAWWTQFRAKQARLRRGDSILEDDFEDV